MSRQTSPFVALVTGSATGAGRACALRFAKLGYAICINFSRSKKEAEETLVDVSKLGVPAIMHQTSVADDAGVREMIRRCRDELGGLNVLVNNAGTTHFIAHADLESLTDQVWDDIFSVNVKGTFHCCRAAMPLLKERKGNIVNITSVAGLQGHGSSIPYAMSKAALNCMTQSLARAFAPEVRVNAVAPGPIQTRWLAGREELVEASLKVTPLKRACTPDDVAEVVEFLACGAAMMTGQVLVVDGGRTM
jgi:NAD(P)-dependent dehydrogenase (short-subunit alcohol dehydrogenase family)